MFSIYEPPKLHNQFAFEKAVQDHLNESEAIFIDQLDNWHLEKIVAIVDHNSEIMKINFCSKYKGRLYCLASMFKYNKLWFIDTEKKDKGLSPKTEHMDGYEFLTVSRV